MAQTLIGCVEFMWTGTPAEQVLDEIRQAGYDGVPVGYSEATPAQALERLARHGLRPAPGYYAADFWLPERRSSILEDARRWGAFTAGLGLRELYVATGGWGGFVGQRGLSRMQVAGRATPADGLSADQRARFADTLNAFGAALLAEGVRACFHNHVGTVVESAEEIETLLEQTDPACVFLGPDTGHLAWAGVEPVDFCRRHRARILTMHLKDIDPAVRERGVAAGWDYRTFEAEGLFIENGQGGVNFPELLALLRETGFGGWLIVETDRPRQPTGLASATVSREYLRSLDW